MIKISALCTTHDLILIPHAGAMHSGVHFSFSQSPAHTPMIEYLVKWMPILQYFCSIVLPHMESFRHPCMFWGKGRPW